MMTKIVGLNEYQQRALETWLSHSTENGYNIVYPTLGLSGESGEVAEKVKKVLRDNNGKFTDDLRKSIALEISDVLWYASVLAHELGFSLQEIAEMNYEKLRSRRLRGKIHGDGDNR